MSLSASVTTETLTIEGSLRVMIENVEWTEFAVYAPKQNTPHRMIMNARLIQRPVRRSRHRHSRKLTSTAITRIRPRMVR